MKSYLQLFDYILWIVIVAMQWCLLLVAVRSGMRKIAPNYVLFVAFLSLQSTALFVVSRYLSYSAYVLVFYAGMAVETLLLIFVLYEIFRSAFDPLGSLPPRTVAKLVASIVLISTVALTLAISSPAVNPDAVVALLRTFHRSAEFVVALSLWSVVIYARALGIPWRSRIAGITIGFLVYLTMQSLVTAAIGLNPGRTTVTWLSRIGIVSYLGSLMVWMAAVRRQEVAVELPAPDAMGKLRSLVAQARSDSGKLTVQSKTKWSAQ